MNLPSNITNQPTFAKVWLKGREDRFGGRLFQSMSVHSLNRMFIAANSPYGQFTEPRRLPSRTDMTSVVDTVFLAPAAARAFDYLKSGGPVELLSRTATGPAFSELRRRLSWFVSPFHTRM